MKVTTSFLELREARESLKATVGLVPTMGFLHEGHLSLVRAARQECSSVVVTIFVNPAQFGPAEDLSRYPRDLERDLSLLKKENVDLVWAPPTETLYPADFQTWVDLEKVSKPLEGAMRPGHFKGVATIVAKLFNAIQPQKAFFGQKDAQQAAVIRQMVKDLNYPIEVIICPIAREGDGLAMSSRNVYLQPAERQAATVLSRALFAIRQAFEDGERDAGQLKQIMQTIFNQEPLARVQYISCADPVTLQELESIENQALFSVAVFIGNTRLIDNMLVP
ncbi:MAG: pantoate--beta-alanine ligase [Anaerolineaceae bacterium]|nr:pantoate--beta-alanine ligase [Anaerolineaceae bacterium]